MINALIVQAARSRASDIFVKPGYPVSVRDKNGKLKKKDVIPQRDDIQKFLNETIDRKSLLKDILHSFDTEYGEFDVSMTVVVKHFCNSTTYIFKNDIELHKEFDNHYMNVAYHGCTNHRQILQWNL